VGLGLSIVSKIVDEHHGSIELRNGELSGRESGACFVIFLPLSEQAVVSEAEAASRA
jgi:nitrogen fixation/metabolism regulation signal transduction histidine kinase